MFRSFLFTSAIWCGFVSVVFGHGEQIQLTIDSNKITTREVLSAEPYGPGISSPKSLYMMPIVTAPRVTVGIPDGTFQWLTYPTPTQPVTNSGPGIAYGNSTFAPSTTITWKILDGLKYWDGSAFVDPGSEQLEVFRGSAGSATPANGFTVTSDSGPFGSLPVTLGSSILSNAHSTYRFRLLGTRSADLNTFNDRIVEPDNGIYLAKFSLSTNQMNGMDPIADSDPFYFLLNKNGTAAEYAGAINGAMTAFGISESQIQAIPEPSTWAIGAIGLLGLGYYRRLRRRS